MCFFTKLISLFNMFIVMQRRVKGGCSSSRDEDLSKSNFILVLTVLLTGHHVFVADMQLAAGQSSVLEPLYDTDPQTQIQQSDGNPRKRIKTSNHSENFAPSRFQAKGEWWSPFFYCNDDDV